jgi:hypothetical protein
MRILLIILSVIAGATSALAHSGGTDANGCHQDHQRGGYHCH